MDNIFSVHLGCDDVRKPFQLPLMKGQTVHYYLPLVFPGSVLMIARFKKKKLKQKSNL